MIDEREVGTRGSFLWRSRRAAAGVLVALLAGTAWGVFNAQREPEKASATAPAPSADAFTVPGADEFVARQFSRFAINALLVTLIDDDEPPRWSDAALNHLCGPDTRVEIDGQPLQHGSTMPATAFTVRWHMHQCRALETYGVSGVVELLVFHEDEGLSAVVNPQPLIVSNEQGTARLTEPFAAAVSFLAEVGIEPLDGRALSVAYLR